MSKLTVSVERELLELFVSGRDTWRERREMRLLLDKTKFLSPPEPVGEVSDMKYNVVRFYRATGDTSKPYLLPGTKLYVEQPVTSIVLPERKPQDLANEFQLAEEWHEETGYNQALNDVIRLNGL